MAPSADSNMSKIQTESSDRKESALPCKEENIEPGPRGFMENNFFENIDDFLELPEQKATIVLRKSYYNCRGSTSVNEKIINTQEMDQVFNHKQYDMQTDEIPHKLQAELNKPTTNKEISHDRKANTPLET
ncbi:4342_t:CDS:2, partial [Gigaspora margarita]